VRGRQFMRLFFVDGMPNMLYNSLKSPGRGSWQNNSSLKIFLL
jgi:hypothetical protein